MFPAILPTRCAMACAGGLGAVNKLVKQHLIVLNNDNADYQHLLINSKWTYPLAKFVANFASSF